MGRGGRWLWAEILAGVGLAFLVAGGVISTFLLQSIAQQTQEVARLRVATADSLKERGARVLIEGKVSDRMALSDRPPLVAYNEYHLVVKENGSRWQLQRRYAPTLWVQIPGREIEVTAGYRMQSTPSRAESGSERRYEGFQVSDPVLVLGTLSVAGGAVVDNAQVGFETKQAYLLSLQQSQTTASQLGLFFLVLGGGLTLGAATAAYVAWQQDKIP